VCVCPQGVYVPRENHANPLCRGQCRDVINTVALEQEVGQSMNKKQLIQAAIDLTVAILAGYIVMLAPVTGTASQPPARELPGKMLMVQIEAL
jgi:hypothetical protein